MKFYQKEIILKPYTRGFHVITDQITAAASELLA